jgi:hypothetical protein
MAFVEANVAGEITSVIMKLSTLPDFPRTSPADGIISHLHTDRHDTRHRYLTGPGH